MIISIISFFTISLTVFYLVLMGYYTWGWYRLPVWQNKSTRKLATKVSVLVPARDEAAHIEKCLTALADQTYSKQYYEILVIDDHSNDHTAQLAEKTRISNLDVIRLSDSKDSSYSKKQAIAKGIERAKGELIVTTDADCHVQPTWLENFVAYYENYRPKMMAAPVKFENTKGLLGLFQQFDFLGMVGISGGSMANGFPQVCNGANLAYEKEAFQKVKGFAGIDDLPTGDDMLLMQKIHDFFPGQVHFIKSQEMIVKTAPVTSFKALLNQRIRWGSKNRALYDKRVSWVLLLVWLFNISLLMNAVLVCWFSQLIPVFLVQLIGKFLIDFAFFGFVLRFFREIKLLWLFLPTQLLHILYIIFVGIAANTVDYSWRSRKVINS